MQEKISKDKIMYNYLQIKDRIRKYPTICVFSVKDTRVTLSVPITFGQNPLLPANSNSNKVCSGVLEVKEV